jgi:predicted nucleic acid-binding protein
MVCLQELCQNLSIWRNHSRLTPQAGGQPRILPEVWDRSIRLADRGRWAGVIVPLADLLIYACAKLNGVDVAHDDSHFDELAKLEA